MCIQKGIQTYLYTYPPRLPHTLQQQITFVPQRCLAEVGGQESPGALSAPVRNMLAT